MTVYYGTIPEDAPDAGAFQPKMFGVPEPPALTAEWEATSATNIRGTFSEPVLRNRALTNAGNYELVAPEGVRTPIVRAVTCEDVDEPTYVDLTVDECQEGGEYTGNIHLVEKAG